MRRNIYTGDLVDNFYEALGYNYFKDFNKKIHIEMMKNKIVQKIYEFEYETNTEYTIVDSFLYDFKFIILSKGKEQKEQIVLVNYDMINNDGNQLRQSFAESWNYFKNGYYFILNEKLYLEYTDEDKNKISLIIVIEENN